MAKNQLLFIATVAAVVFFFSFTLCNARIPPTNGGDEEDITANSITKSSSSSYEESSSNNNIRLPTDDSKTHSDDQPAGETQESDEPLHIHTMNLFPVDDRPLRRPFRFRHHHHHHHRMYMPMRQQSQGEIPYGDDMIVASGENGDFNPGMFHGGVRQIPARWVKIRPVYRHHHTDNENDNKDDAFDPEKFKMFVMHYRHHRHHHRHNEDEGERFEERKEEGGGGGGGGFMKRIRKFLHHF